MVDRVEHVHARQPERQAAEGGKADVYRNDRLGDHVRARHDFFGAVRGFGLEQAHATDAQQWQNRHGHGDKADAAEPVQQRAPHQDARRHVVQAAEHRSAGRSDAGHAFEEGVGVADVLGQQKRQGREDAHHQPAADRQQVHVPRAQVHMFRASLDNQGQAGDKGDHAGPEKRRQVAGAVEDHQGGHRHDHADRQGDQEDADDETNDP
ncbi:hypothetical protein D3C78_669420 [compost metagenome]